MNSERKKTLAEKVIKIVGYTVMILLSGAGAAASAFMGGLPNMWRGFILGCVLSLSIAIGDSFVSKNKLKNNLIQIVTGVFAGLIAAVLIIFFKMKPLHSDFPLELNSVPLIIFLGAVYGGAFQWIVVCPVKKKFLKLFLVAFCCIYVKFYEGLLAAFPFVSAGALVFAALWYLPVWFFYVRKRSIADYIKCIPLNLRMLKLVLAKRWLSMEDYAKSYDQVAAAYDGQWLCQLRPVTEKLLDALPGAGDGDILDLGCGTGLSALYLEKKYPDNPVIGVDISPAMLEIARKKCSRAEFVEADILDFLRKRPADSAALIFSGWAIGYSSPPRVIYEAARILRPGGAFAFVVNYYDTLAPVFYAFRKCMNEFPEQVNMALNPNFPHHAKEMLKRLKKNGFTAALHADGNIPIHAPDGEITLEWLLKTGVLAGFDQVMPLRDNKELAAYFNKVLRETAEPVEHHYFMGIFVR